MATTGRRGSAPSTKVSSHSTSREILLDSLVFLALIFLPGLPGVVVWRAAVGGVLEIGMPES